MTHGASSTSPSHHAAPQWQSDGAAHVWMPYTQMKTAPMPMPVASTEGVYWILEDGRRIIDGLASWWTACHGYNQPHMVSEVEKQLRRMPHVMFGGVHHQPALRLAARLSKMLPGDLNHVFFSDSGSVAVEVALKIAVQYWLNQNVHGRVKFVSFRHAYHGDTTGAMSVCDPLNSMHAHFKGFLLEQFPQEIPQTKSQFQQFERFLRDKQKDIAGVIIEPLIQGAGGMKFHPPETLAGIRRLCHQFRLLMIADEIAVNFGRTGTIFACQQAEITPDIICLGKALTGGMMGLAATVAADHVWTAFYSDDPSHALMHGPTYMANPLACTAANASLDLFESQPRLRQAVRVGDVLRYNLRDCEKMKGVADVRCFGAVGVVQVDDLHHVDRLRGRFVEEGVWLRPFRDIIYLTPPLTISDDQLNILCGAVVRVIKEWSNW